MASVPVGKEVTRNDWTPLGIPIDLRIDLDKDPNVGWIKDSELLGEDEDDYEAVDALDKSMKNRGWMKGSDSQTTNGGDPHRNIDTMGRRILCTEYMVPDVDYYLRIKQLLDKNDAQYLFDYMELVPKSVYDFDEDKH